MAKEKKILIIEDEMDVADYLKVVLQSNGYIVKTCQSAREGVDRVTDFSPDLICLDIMMPEETGMSFYVHLRQSKKDANIPVVILSGVIQEKDFDFRSYVSDKSIPPPECYFEKPINLEEFLATVRRLTNKKPVGG